MVGITFANFASADEELAAPTIGERKPQAPLNALRLQIVQQLREHCKHRSYMTEDQPS